MLKFKLGDVLKMQNEKHLVKVIDTEYKLFGPDLQVYTLEFISGPLIGTKYFEEAEQVDKTYTIATRTERVLYGSTEK